MGTKTRAIRITETEWSALCSAAALYEVYAEDDLDDTDITRTRRAEVRALDRLIGKWHKAGDRA